MYRYLYGLGTAAAKAVPNQALPYVRQADRPGIRPLLPQRQNISYGRVQELKRLTEEADIQILLAGCADPDLKAAALQEKFQGVTPAEALKAMLLPGEIADLAIAVEKLSGYRRTTIEEVKNG